MKATVVEQMICESAFALVHGMSYPIKRLIVDLDDERPLLVITPTDQETYVYFGFNLDDESVKIIKDIEIPDELVTEALHYQWKKEEFEKFKPKFENLTEGN